MKTFFLRREDGINNLYPAIFRSTDRISEFASSLASQIILHWFWPFRRITRSPAMTSSIRSASAMKSYFASGKECSKLSVAWDEGRAAEPTKGGEPGDKGLVLFIQLACGPEGGEDLSRFLESIPVTCWIWKSRAASPNPPPPPPYWLPTLNRLPKASSSPLWKMAPPTTTACSSSRGDLPTHPGMKAFRLWHGVQ